MRYFYVRDLVERKEIEVEYMGTQDQAADALTKPVDRQRLSILNQMMGLE